MMRGRASAIIEVYYTFKHTNGEDLLAARYQQQCKDVFGADSSLDKLFVEGVSREQGIEALSQLAAKNQIRMAQSAAESAAAMLLHTGFENFVAACVRVIFVLDRNSCLSEVPSEMRQVSINDAKEDIDSCVTKCLSRYLDSILKRSLPRRVDFVCNKLKIWKDFYQVLSQDDLTKFDRARHDSVHSDGKLIEAVVIADVSAKMMLCASRLLLGLHQRFGLKFTAEELVGAGLQSFTTIQLANSAASCASGADDTTPTTS